MIEIYSRGIQLISIRMYNRRYFEETNTFDSRCTTIPLYRISLYFNSDKIVRLYRLLTLDLHGIACNEEFLDQKLIGKWDYERMTDVYLTWCKMFSFVDALWHTGYNERWTHENRPSLASERLTHRTGMRDWMSSVVPIMLKCVLWT